MRAVFELLGLLEGETQLVHAVSELLGLLEGENRSRLRGRGQDTVRGVGDVAVSGSKEYFRARRPSALTLAGGSALTHLRGKLWKVFDVFCCFWWCCAWLLCVGPACSQRSWSEQ